MNYGRLPQIRIMHQPLHQCGVRRRTYANDAQQHTNSGNRGSFLHASVSSRPFSVDSVIVEDYLVDVQIITVVGRSSNNKSEVIMVHISVHINLFIIIVNINININIVACCAVYHPCYQSTNK
jgi:hypothetical protein